MSVIAPFIRYRTAVKLHNVAQTHATFSPNVNSSSSSSAYPNIILFYSADCQNHHLFLSHHSIFSLSLQAWPLRAMGKGKMPLSVLAC